MTFDKDYPNRKDKRKPYFRSGVSDKSCRPGGDCKRCQEGRNHNTKKRLKSAKDKEREK